MNWRLLLTVAVVAVVVEIARRLGAQQILETMMSQHPGWLALAISLSLMNLSLSADRSRWLLPVRPRLLPVVRITSVACIVNHLTLFTGGGIATKVVGFQRLGASPANSARAVGLEVLLDVLVTTLVTLCGLLLFGIGRFTATPHIESIALTALVVLCCALIVVYTVLRLARTLDTGGELQPVTPHMPSSEGKRVLRCLASSCTVWATAGLSFYCLLRGAGQFVAAPMAFVAICSGFLLSLATFVPGGLGVRDLAWSTICANLTGVPMTASLAAALTLRLVNVFSSAIIVVALEGLRLIGFEGTRE